MRRLLLLFLIYICSGKLSHVFASGYDVQHRISKDLSSGQPIVVHVVVALCDNKYQGIVPVPKGIGDGQNPSTNLYWGAGYGIRSFFSKHSWTTIRKDLVPAPKILERVVLYKEFHKNHVQIPVFIIAEAWDGKEIRSATHRFLDMAAGHSEESIPFMLRGKSVSIRSGGAAHLLAYVGHDGLMDFNLSSIPSANPKARPRSSIVLACASFQFFRQLLTQGGSHQLLLTTGLMAPEAYTLEAAIDAWVSNKSSQEVLNAAAAAYDHHQHCGLRAAKKLFYSDP